MEIILYQEPDGEIGLEVEDDEGYLAYATLTPDQAQHLSNRLQAFAKSQMPCPETVLET